MAGGTRKHGKNKEFCKKYRLEGRREKNKAIRLLRHIRKTKANGQTDEVAEKAFKNMSWALKGAARDWSEHGRERPLGRNEPLAKRSGDRACRGI